MPSTRLQKLLGDLRAARSQATTVSERSAIDGAIADILDGIFATGGMPEVGAAKPTLDVPSETPSERPMSKLSPFYGIGLKEACPKLLSIIGDRGNKTPQAPREIWEHLKAEGWTSNHSDPVHSVNDALRRRAKTHGDVLLVGSGKWGRTDWYSDADLERIRKGGMGGRDRGEHIEATKAGMATAKQRGARLGAVNRLSAEQGKQILDLARTGLTKEKIAKQFEISTASVTNYVKRQGYSSLRELRAEAKKLQAAAADPSTESDPEETRH
jgi:transposase